MKRLTSFAIVSILTAAVILPLLTSCGTPASRRYRTNINGLPVDIGSLTSGGLSCSSIGVGTRPTQSDLDLCKKYLPEKDGAALQILWQYFDEVVLDGVHEVQTCPILTLYPLEQGHKNGTISDQDFATRLYQFYKDKYKQNLNGKQGDCKAALVAAGLPLP